MPVEPAASAPLDLDPVTAPPEQAEPLFGAFCAALESEGIEVARGLFGACMRVEIANDGPVTLALDT